MDQEHPLVKLAEKQLADRVPVREVVAAVVEQIAADLPMNYRQGVQGEYRSWLWRVAMDVRGDSATGSGTGGPVTGELGRWQ